MPDSEAQYRRHEEYVDLPVIGYTVWWHEAKGLQWAGRMPERHADMVVAQLRIIAGAGYWKAPLYHWDLLLSPDP